MAVVQAICAAQEPASATATIEQPSRRIFVEVFGGRILPPGWKATKMFPRMERPLLEQLPYHSLVNVHGLELLSFVNVLGFSVRDMDRPWTEKDRLAPV
jgi:hypothetical protein